MASLESEFDSHEITELNRKYQKIRDITLGNAYGARFDDGTKCSCISEFTHVLQCERNYLQMKAFKLMKNLSEAGVVIPESVKKLNIFCSIIDNKPIEITDDVINSYETILKRQMEALNDSLKHEHITVKSYDDFNSVIEYFFEKHSVINEA